MAPLTVLLLLGLAFAVPAGAEPAFEGRVFLDTDGDGRLGEAEAPLPGVAVENGERTTRSDEQGRFRLADTGDGFVRVVRPRGIACDPWYRTEPGDFPCRRIDDEDDFLFVHLTDAHVFPTPQDFVAFSLPRPPAWIPGFVTRPLYFALLGRFNRELDAEQIEAALRSGLPEDQRGLPRSRLLPALEAEFVRPGSESGQVAAEIRRAFDEVAALEPRFVVSTGDLILEGNRATPVAARRWMDLYVDEVTRVEGRGIAFFHTLGNNELVSSDRGRGAPGDPDVGKGLYRRRLGPTTYAFDRGRFHFVVTDTHVMHRGEYSFYRFDPKQRRRLEADVLAHRDQPVAVLNHEPFAFDPDADMDALLARDEGLLARTGVDYALSGHIHRNGVWHDGVTTHVSTGALSGMRWFLPAAFVERGMRLVFVRGDRLFSAWKRLGEPAVGFVTPGHGAPLWPSGAERAEPDELVVFAADATGPFAEVELLANGETAPLEPWGRYFGRAERREGVAYELIARRADGTELRAELLPSRDREQR
ncbi:MAG: metallophosphoesterase [Myxococcota bacterium]|nr:metallophosphoesterase [Myxococcota bacterium]